MPASSLVDLASRLRASLDGPTIFTCINTRLILQTGVNLKQISSEQDRDPSVIRKVEAALANMGVSLGAK